MLVLNTFDTMVLISGRCVYSHGDSCVLESTILTPEGAQRGQLLHQTQINMQIKIHVAERTRTCPSCMISQDTDRQDSLVGIANVLSFTDVLGILCDGNLEQVDSRKGARKRVKMGRTADQTWSTEPP